MIIGIKTKGSVPFVQKRITSADEILNLRLIRKASAGASGGDKQAEQ